MDRANVFPPERPVDLKRRYTYAELCEVMDETNRPHELWHGTLVMEPPPACSHQLVVGRLYRALAAHVESRGLGEALISPVGMLLTPDTMLEPDVAFVAAENLRRIARVIEGPADWVAEVISSSKPERDWIRKRDLYEQFGVREYWIVDPQRRVVEVFGYSRSRRYRTLGRYFAGEFASSRLLPGFRIGVACLFDGQR